MIVTPFGELTYGDHNGLQAWIEAHRRQHGVEVHALAALGLPVPSPILGGPITPDWFLRHWHTHVTNAQASGVALNASTLGLSVSRWISEAAFYSWHLQHNRVHLEQDTVLKLTT